MSGKKIWAGIFLLSQSLAATATDASDLKDTVAECAGRISAEMEFAWLRSDPDSDRLEAQRKEFIEILEALGPSQDPKQQMALRIHAKMAHAGLLTTAYFGTNESQAAWAKRHAVLYLENCQNMLLKS